jgi:hypothetical protein
MKKTNGQRSALFFSLKVQRSAGRVRLRGVAGRSQVVGRRVQVTVRRHFDSTPAKRGGGVCGRHLDVFYMCCQA